MEWLRGEDGGWGTTWGEISRWAYGIQHRDDLKPWNGSPQYEIGLKDCQHDLRRTTLQSICGMNLKKTPGGSATNDAKSFKNIVEDDKENIQEQYALYDPDLTICCGKFPNGKSIFKEVMNYKESERNKHTNRGEEYYERCSGKYVIDFVHPANRSPIKKVTGVRSTANG